MNIKLNLKVLHQMEEDFLQLHVRASQLPEKKWGEHKAALMREISEKLQCVKTLQAHYRAVLEQSK